MSEDYKMELILQILNNQLVEVDIYATFRFSIGMS